VAVVSGATGLGLVIVLAAAFLLVRWYRRRTRGAGTDRMLTF
jgi:hypothetical protein